MKKSSKKFIALLLSAIMLVTSIPLGAFIASAADGDAKDKYLFAYFTGNSQYGQQIRFAVSEDGYNFTALNKNRPVVSQTKGSSATSSGFARDPYIARDVNGNGYWMVATDMDASPSGMHGSWEGDSCIYTYHSTDLTDWTQVACIDMRNFSGFETARRAWAPQFIWDASKNQYMIYLTIFSSSSSWDNSIYALYTSDFQSVTAPQAITLNKTTSGASIDSDIIENNGTYYMYFKDESSAKVWVATSSNLTGPYTAQKDVSSTLSSKDVEGNAMYRITGTNTWVMMLDEYNNGTFAYGTTTDFINFTPYTGSTANNAALAARHGSVMPITTEEYNRIVEFYNSASSYTEFSYPWTEELAGGNTGSWDLYRDTTGYELHLQGKDAGVHYEIKNGHAFLNKFGMIVQDERVKSLIASDSFSIGFSYKAQTLTPNAPIFTIYDGSGSGHINYVELLESGQLTIGGNVVASIADFKPAEENKFVFSYNGSTFSVYMNGKLAASAPADFNVKIVGDLYLGLGYNDARTSIVGTYGQVNCTATAVNENVSLTGFEDVMAAFEKKLADGALYKNMGDAYDAYVKCQKAYDAYNYGGDESVDLTAAATELRVAMLSMVKWEIPIAKATNKPRFQKDPSDTSAIDWAYNGVLWGDSTLTTDIAKRESWASTSLYVRYPEVTFLYTGADEEKLTSAIGICGAGTGNATKSPRYICGAESNNSNITLDIYWRCKNENNANNWNYVGMVQTNYNTQLATNANGGAPNGAAQIRGNNGLYNYSIYCGNVMRLSPSFGASEYVKDYKPNLTVFLNTSNSFSSTYEPWNTGEMTRALHVVNYKPLYDYVMKSDNIASKIADYSEGGMGSYFTYLDTITPFDPNSYFTSSNDYSGCANAIKTIAENLPSDSSFTQDSAAYKNLRKAIEDYCINVKAPECVSVQTFENYKEALKAAQNAMKAVYSDEKGYARLSNDAIQTLADNLNKAGDSYSKSTHSYKWSTDDKQTAKFVCLNDSSHTFDLECQNYYTIDMIYNTLDKSKYTDEAWAAIQSEKVSFDNCKKVFYSDYDLAFSQIDAAQRNLLSIINNPIGGNKDKENQKFTVYFQINFNGQIEPGVDKYITTYGQVVTADIAQFGTEHKFEGYNVQSWTIKFSNGTEKTVTNTDSAYTLLVQEDTTIIANINNTATYVNILNQYGNVLYSIPASADDVISCDGNTVTIAGKTYTVPNMPYMNVTGYTVNGVKYTSETEFKVKAGENKIVPKYDPVVSDYTITANGATVTVNDNATNKAEYDDVVTVTFPVGTYAVAIENSDGSYAVAAYGNTYTFYANRNMTFYAVNGSASNYTIGGTALDKEKDALTIHRLDYQLPFAYAEAAVIDATAGKYTTFCSYSTETPAFDETAKTGVRILEKGILAVSPANAAAYDESNLKLDTGDTNIKAIVNAATAGSGNQYSFTITKNGTGAKTRAYVKYTYVYDGREITAVSYGNICTAQ